ncbi:protein UNC 32, a [Trichuris trichiura]|uniref:V-type proton ATPase subunit a n=1 Tax=Trichuris trichiura TaxID=36087 RepID=A0A077Z165_TRITR|nr:protein UNC 32, a [Trichuris trichiura]
MGSLFRSEEMCRCQMFLQTEAAYACVSELGELGLVQFRDLNPDVTAFQRKFVNEVRRCDEMERKLRFLEREIKKDHITMLDTGENPDAPQAREMIDLEVCLKRINVNANAEMLQKNFLELTELKHILRKTFVAGVILRERIPAFERLLWRACRGNVFLKQAEISEPLEDPVLGDQVHKTVIVIFFQGEQLKTRVKKICEGYINILSFRATLEMAIGVMTRIEDLKTVLGQTQDHRHRVLVAAAKNIRIWFTKVRKIKAIYHTLNLFNLDVTQKCLIAECWCPVSDLDKIQLEESGSSVPSILNRMYTDESPPTYNRTNKFTAGFQNIVDAYGVANYREVNPAPYTIITFPFLFAVMFGDLGHGIIMLLFALFLILKEKQLIARKIRNEMFQIFFGGRYIILLMGLFSMYTGIIYNELFAKSFNIFGSSWQIPDDITEISASERLQLNPNSSAFLDNARIVFFKVWNVAVNKLNFLNSFKMKMSIILGVFQMTFGVVLSFFFNRKLDIYSMFIPQLLFLCCLFVYLCIMIIYKWAAFTAYGKQMAVGYYPGGHCAPSLLIGLINMVKFTPRDYGFDDPATCATNAFYPGQLGFESFLVIVAVLCAPVMLFTKPYFIHRRRKQASYNGHVSVRADLKSDDAEVIHHKEKEVSHGGGDHDDLPIGEILILQAIHTIEFCLSSISHTASYLRLWALSLAHAQLSEVLWSMVMRMGFIFEGYMGALAIYLVFWAFAFLTLSILVMMEGLSAFLHALRLHWVEFQSKFYGGEGYLFTPFSFDTILEQARIEDGD